MSSVASKKHGSSVDPRAEPDAKDGVVGSSDLPPPIRTERPPPDAGRYALVATAGSGVRRSAGTPRLRILVLEDDEWVGACMLEVLGEAGHDVTLVRTLAEARRQITSAAPDLLTLDLQLEGELGTELLGELNGVAGAPAVVIVSAYRSIELVAERYGVPFVRKPFDIEHLVAAVGRAAPRAATG